MALDGAGLHRASARAPFGRTPSSASVHIARGALRAAGALRLRAVLGNESLPAQEYSSAGEHSYEQSVPPAALRDGAVSVRFELDRSMRPAAPDLRELGIQVVFWSNDGATPTALRPIAIE